MAENDDSAQEIVELPGFRFHPTEEEIVELPGFRFHPTDEELVSFYLKRKIQNRPAAMELINLLDIYKYDPWDLPSLGASRSREKEWYFYCQRDRKYRNSTRPNRVTSSGFWKATGTDKPIYSSYGSSRGSSHCIGLKKTLVFYLGRAAKGTKTDWMMHEFRLPPCPQQNSRLPHDSWVICKIFKKTNSARQGAVSASFHAFENFTSSSCLCGLSGSFASSPMEASSQASVLADRCLLDPSQAIDQIVRSEGPLQIPNGFSDSFLENVEGVLEVGEDDNGGFQVKNQWEEGRSIGFPVSLQSNDAWKPSAHPFDLSKFLVEMSAGDSSNKFSASTMD